MTQSEATHQLITLEDQHPVIRRHSFSAPPSLALSSLAGCLKRVSELSSIVECMSKRHKVQVPRSLSVNDLRDFKLTSIQISEEIIDDILTMSVFNSPKPSKKVPQCHQCHAASADESHVGFLGGDGRCQLV